MFNSLTSPERENHEQLVWIDSHVLRLKPATVRFLAEAVTQSTGAIAVKPFR
jgi:hypothetical protein